MNIGNQAGCTVHKIE